MFEQLTLVAKTLGATGTAVVPAEMLVIDERFADLCGAPHRCPSYGLAPGCPPHAMRPAQFRQILGHCKHILVFKIDAPAADLVSEQRVIIARNIHRIASTLEQTALDAGWQQVRGMAAGSCKELFCSQDESCVVLECGLPCRHPDLARPSISAVGVDFQALADRVGWAFSPISPEEVPDEPTMGLMAGLVLLG